VTAPPLRTGLDPAVPPAATGATAVGASPRAAGVRTWPLALLLAGYPVLWLAGLAFLALPALAAPMAWELYRRGRVRLPAGFGFFLLLLVIALLSGAMLADHAPGTLPNETGPGRYLAFALRLANYAAAGVILLFVGNLTERELPAVRVVRWLSMLFLVTVAGGVAGLLLPPVQLATPAGFLLPGVLLDNGFVRQLVTVSFAQWHTILGEQTAPRPSAPFVYTNAWGNMLSLLLPWFVVGAVLWARGRWRRYAAVGVLAVAVLPVVYSLNRGLWLGLLAITAYALFRLVRRGNLVPAAIMLAVIGAAGVLVATTPLAGLVLERIETPHSNDRRSSIAIAAVDAATHSPFIGYGGQLSMPGSERSIAIGPTPDCPRCGNREVGGEGQLFLLLVSTGFAGTACYVAWLVRTWWRYRRDSSPVGIAGAATLVLTLFYLPIYASVGMPLAVTAVGIGLWWRHATATPSTSRS
jgi:hypothetical protein